MGGLGFAAVEQLAFGLVLGSGLGVALDQERNTVFQLGPLFGIGRGQVEAASPHRLPVLVERLVALAGTAQVLADLGQLRLRAIGQGSEVGEFSFHGLDTSRLDADYPDRLQSRKRGIF
jgi:hypothetical protein